jgi:diguanylate cyclase (GGDEF)-like protein
MEEDYKAEMDTPLMDPMNKEIVGPMVSSGKWGWLISVYHPVNADDGSVIAYVCVDIDVNLVVARTNKLRMVLGFIQGTFLILFGASIYIFFRSSVLSPLLRLEKAALHFKEKMSKDEEAQSMAKRKDEFGALYRALSDMEDVILSDREKLEEYVEKIRVMAYQDELTGVKNLNSYDKKLEELDLQIKSGEAVFAVVMVDMNDLKVVNDMFGHGKGDIALKVTSHKICETFKHSPVFRIGGDEFVVILQGRDYEDRDKLVSELRKGEVRRNLEAKEPWQQFCVSVGCAEYKPGTHRSTKNVFDEADNLMYEHKKMLGGRVEDYKRRLA